MTNEFIYAQPVKIFFGQGEFQKLGAVLDELGVTRAVLCCGRHFASDASRLMAEEPRIVAVFGEVEQNPQLSGITETGVIGIGGGSSLDTAKFAAAVAPNPGEPIDYYEGKRPLNARNRLPVVAVPTTAGTGSEVTQVSVVSHGTEKKTINNPAFMPAAAIVDPLLSASVPPRTTMNTGLDAMAHASMALAALLGGLSFALPKTAASHACSYPLSEDYHLPHGEACAFTLDSLVKINADERLEHLCHAVGLKDTDELAARIRALKALGGLRSRLSDLGDVDLAKLCRDCAAHPLMKNNPVSLDEEALREMFEALA